VKLKKLEREVMPKDVATNALVHDRLNRSQQATIASHRWTIWVPEESRTDEQEQEYRSGKLAIKLSKASCAQLIKWTKRTANRRTRLQKRAEKVHEETINAEKALEAAVEAGFESQATILRRRLNLLGAAERTMSERAMVMDEVWSLTTATAKSRGVKL
jgi:hypothetical protein